MFGGSNVTYLTGIFQSVLPDVSRNILHTVQSALKEADWAESRKVFGIRHVYFTSFEGKSLAEHQADLEAAKPKPAFVVLPPEAREQQARDERQKILENRRTEEHRRSKHVQAVPDTSYVVVLQISDRNSFIGGNLLVHHHDAGHGAGRDEDYYDDEEEERLKGQWEAKESVKVPYLVPGQGIEVLTPERGSVVVVPGRKPFGLDAVTHGVRKSLVLELWPFRDAPMGTGRADGTVGRKLGEAGDDKQEL